MLDAPKCCPVAGQPTCDHWGCKSHICFLLHRPLSTKAAASMEAAANAQAVSQVPEKLSNTDSLAVVLSQALQAGDKALLDKCLGVSNERVIRNTVSQLQSSQAVVLLEAATQRLQSSPQRGKEVSAWLRAVLLAHTASIMASSGGSAGLFLLSATTCQPECMNTLSAQLLQLLPDHLDPCCRSKADPVWPLRSDRREAGHTRLAASAARAP